MPTQSNKLNERDLTTDVPSHMNLITSEDVYRSTWSVFIGHIRTASAALTHALTSKTTPVDADEIEILDSAASYAPKRLTWANLKATAKTYFDTLYALASHIHSAADLTSGTLPDARFPATLPALNGNALTALNASALGSGTVPDARFPSTLPALNGSALTNLNASAISSGTIDTARLPFVASGVQVVSSGAIANLSAPQQAEVVQGAVVTTTDGRRWTYSGSGSKASEASYIELADVSPVWSAIADKPSTFAPSAHASAHASGGGDALKLDDLATPDDNTDLNASTLRHGLLRKLNNNPSQFLDGQGNWAVPSGGALVAPSGGALVRGSGLLQGHTAAGSAATSPPPFVFSFGSPYTEFALNLVVDGGTYSFHIAAVDPQSPPLIWIDSTGWVTVQDVAAGIAAGINGQSIPNIVAEANMASPALVTVSHSGTGAATSLDGSLVNAGVDNTTSGGGSGTDAVAPSGAITEITLIAQDGAKNIKPVKLGTSGEGINIGIEIALKIAGPTYYPVCNDLAANHTTGEATISTLYTEWLGARTSAALVARMAAAAPVGGSLTLWAIVEQS